MKRMAFQLRIAICLSLLVPMVMAQNGGLRFTLTDLGTFGGLWSAANAINENGQIVGTYGFIYNDATNEGCFLLNSGGPRLFTGTGKFCDARAIDSFGTISGGMKTTKYGSRIVAFRRDTNGVLNILSPLSNTVDSWGYGVYQQTVVGVSASQAVEWRSETNRVALGPSGSQANGINSKGEVVGFSNAGDSYDTAWMWQNGSLTNFALFQTGDGTNARAITSKSLVAGSSFRPDGSEPADTRPEIWDAYVPSNPPLDFGLAPFGDAEVLAVSNDKWIVGGFPVNDRLIPGYFTVCAGYGCAFLAGPDPHCGAVNLNDLLDASGSGWFLISASGINDKHQIVGWGYSPIAPIIPHAFLLTPNNNLPLCYPD